MDCDDTPLAEPPLVDDALLAGLREALGPATDGLIAKAADVVEDRLAKLKALATDPISDGFARLAHEIGGVSGQVGLARLSREALALEHLARIGEAAKARAVAESLDELARASLAAMQGR
ncbi:MAG: Hpt domain-containing protein [Rhodobacteraceae bacterium]|nr:MAG: Hpt domain-containing protein [Paracoccaceae bacterium]